VTSIVRNDGGRAAAGFQGPAGDCVVRAISIAARRDYATVYAEMSDLMAGLRKTKKRTAAAGKRSARSGVYTNCKAFDDYITKLGFRWVPCMKIGSGCKVHLTAEELPAGRLIARVSRHVVAVIDGVIHDNHDPSRGGSRCVYGYWILES
jgi:hypothetical protein